jgi:hypothetical protein
LLVTDPRCVERLACPLDPGLDRVHPDDRGEWPLAGREERLEVVDERFVPLEYVHAHRAPWRRESISNSADLDRTRSEPTESVETIGDRTAERLLLPLRLPYDRHERETSGRSVGTAARAPRT